MRLAFDTNFLAYAEGVNGAARRDASLDMIRRLPQEMVVIPAQVLGELFNVLVRKAGRTRSEARDALLGWKDAFSVFETFSEVMVTAFDLATDHQIGVWDSVVLSAAAHAGCFYRKTFKMVSLGAASPWPIHMLRLGILCSMRIWGRASNSGVSKPLGGATGSSTGSPVATDRLTDEVPQSLQS